MEQRTSQEIGSLIASQEILLLFGGQNVVTFFTRTSVGKSSLHSLVYFDEIRYTVVELSAPMCPTRSSP